MIMFDLAQGREDSVYDRDSSPTKPLLGIAERVLARGPNVLSVRRC